MHLTVVLLAATAAAPQAMELPVAASLVSIDGTGRPLVRLELLNASGQRVTAATRSSYRGRGRELRRNRQLLSNEQPGPCGFPRVVPMGQARLHISSLSRVKRRWFPLTSVS